jgi:hypothetical protein
MQKLAIHRYYHADVSKGKRWWSFNLDGEAPKKL